MDRIVVSQLPLRAHVGVPEEERAQEQDILIDMEIGLDLAPAGTRDDIALTVDYEAVCDVLTSMMRTRSYMLIEAVAEDCASAILAAFGLAEEVRVRVSKPAALTAYRAPLAAVQVVRRRA